MNIELVWEALDDLMVAINKKPPANKKVHAERLAGVDHVKMEREKQKGEALGLARAIAILTGATVDQVREEAVRRYVGE